MIRRVVTISLREALEQPCPKCHARAWALRRLVNSAGKVMYPYVCEACDLQTQIYEKHTEVRRRGAEPPEIEPNRQQSRQAMP